MTKHRVVKHSFNYRRIRGILLQTKTSKFLTFSYNTGVEFSVMKQTNKEPGFWLAALLAHLEPRTEETKSSNLMELSTNAKIFLG